MSEEIPKDLLLDTVILSDDFRLNNSILNEMKNKNKKGVLILAYADWCGACNRFKPTFTKFAKEYNGKVLIKALPMHDEKLSDAINKILERKESPFRITYFPTILSFDEKGKFFSRYGSSNDTSKKYRSEEDLTEYANSIGDYSIFTESNKDKKWSQLPSF